MHDLKRFVILIPAYKPVYDQMIPFVKELLTSFDKIVTVDDGGGEAYADVFTHCESLGCRVLRHDVNRGKGAALKTGLKYIGEEIAEAAGVITADCDGQHAVSDIIKVAEALEEHPECLVLGGRRFDGDVPFRSRFGNAFTRCVFKLATGLSVYDTQTGLRGIPSALIPEMLTLQGDRYEFEMNMLLKLREWGVTPFEVTIRTIYLNDNKGSHFNAFKDGLRISARIIKYAAGSILSFIIDYALFLLLMLAVFPHLESELKYALCFGLARAVSSVVNYLYNRFAVFGGKNYKRGATVKYFSLVVVVMLLGMLVQRLTAYVPGGDGIHTVIKIVYDAVMFFVNYIIQRDFVFKIKERKRDAK